MIRLTLFNHDGKPVTPQDLPSAAELCEVVDKARLLILECERLAQQKAPKKEGARGGVPYLN